MGHVGSNAALIVCGAVLVDAAFGEVPSRVHPVVGMGWLTRCVLSWRPTGSARELVFGAGLVAIVVGVSMAVAWTFSVALVNLEPMIEANLGGTATRVASVVVEAVVLSTLFAGRGLIAAGQRMRRGLAQSLDAGREALSHLCSRDASALDRAELCGATVESLAENSSDSFVAPLFWYVVLTLLGAPGLVGAAAYRAANTLDAMVGYRGKYEYLGKCAARFDDLLNWVPARLTALTLLAAAACCRLDVRGGWHVAWREHGATESPNAGWPMALAAGALGVELSKRGCYVLGRGLAPPDQAAIRACERLIGVAFALFTVSASLVLGGVARG